MDASQPRKRRQKDGNQRLSNNQDNTKQPQNTKVQKTTTQPKFSGPALSISQPLTTFLNSQPKLLTSEQVQQFIIKGYLILETKLPKKFHQQIFDKIDSRNISRSQCPGNNVLATIPELEFVYSDPTVKGALQSILGANYALHSHRFPHSTKPGLGGQKWHKDSHWGYAQSRHHRPRWVMAMYYPQTVTSDMGPTAMLPFSQYLTMPKGERFLENYPQSWLSQINSDNSESSKEVYSVVPAGSVILIHYDIWHKATKNFSEIQSNNRYMFKFQFYRTCEPTSPSWSIESEEDIQIPKLIETNKSNVLYPVWKDMWNWITGLKNKKDSIISKNINLSKSEINSFISDDSADFEPFRLKIAYSLGINKNFDVLSTSLTSQFVSVRSAAQYGLVAYGVDDKVLSEYQNILNNFSNQNNRDTWNIEGILFILCQLGLEVKRKNENEWKKIIICLIGVFKKSHNFRFVKRLIVEALCTLLSDDEEENNENKIENNKFIKNDIVPHLVDYLKHEKEEQIKFIMCLVLAIIGGDTISPALEILSYLAWTDPNRYVRSNALFALEKMNTVESNIMWKKIITTSRMCPITTDSSQF